jgi:alpha-L-fucosidase
MKLLLLLLLIVSGGFAQNSNYCALSSTDGEKKIIAKAAQVVPSARQLGWQQLELTAFFHFGINTFTNNE